MSRFDLERYLPYLINRVGVAAVEAFEGTLKRHGLTIAMWRILAVLLHHGPQRITDIAPETTLALSQVSRLVTALQTKGLVSRAKDHTDGRANRIGLTARGTRITTQLLAPALELERTLVAGLPGEAVAELKRTLRRVHENVTAADRTAAG